MPAAQPSKELHALCHEHHVEMRLNQSFVNSDGDVTRALAYACTKPDCLVHYNIFRGYFILTQNGNTNEMDRFPESDVSTMALINRVRTKLPTFTQTPFHFLATTERGAV